MVSHHPAKFGGHRHCGCGDVMLLKSKIPDALASICHYCHYAESTRHIILLFPILVTRTQSSNLTNV